jgi:hypothetical protein
MSCTLRRAGQQVMLTLKWQRTTEAGENYTVRIFMFYTPQQVLFRRPGQGGMWRLRADWKLIGGFVVET